MFWFLLAFFVPPALGALANQALTPLTDWIRSRSYAVLMLLVGIVYEILAFRVPFRAIWLELVMDFTGAIAVMLIMIGLPLNEVPSPRHMPPRDKPRVNGGCASAAVFLLFSFVLFTLPLRVSHSQAIAAEWKGYIALKYHSHNHGSPSFRLSNGDEIEGVDPTTWDAAPNGSRLDKPAWSAFGDIDGHHVRIVRETKVMFLGPFRD